MSEPIFLDMKMPRYNLKYPDWNDVIEFAKWYTDNHMPVIINGSPRIYVTENATSYVAFQHGRFQAEMYIGHPGQKAYTPNHSHPGIDLITIPLNFYETDFWSTFISLPSGNIHGANFPKEGSVFLTCQHWKDDIKMTSAATNWTGKLVGPMQESMIRDNYTNAIFENGHVNTEKLSMI